ncbi:MFS transporter [uncultured Roseobacter sp.]|uniref:MFS transporter n=1 Tax=uncultured Roseobacter sp. TaxID=114847 RepID=UPI0026249C72|nr:MFS transporter [uncultured Roseobacter sp.]
MVRQILPLSALLAGSGFLLFAGGVNSLILPIRGEIEGFSAAALGLLGTGWALGYVAGCLQTPVIVARVGHIRAFGVMCALAAITVLLSLILISPWFWIPLRAISGFCFAGAAMVVESWLNERAEPSTRGKIFGAYTMINLAASTAGQMVIVTGDPSGFLFFVLAAIVYCAALLPTALSASATPAPLVSAKLDIRMLWRNSPVAVFAVLMVGISNASFGTLAAVFAARSGLDVAGIALFASLPILAGAVAQVPVGWLSDKYDRRVVLLGITALAILVDAAFLFLAPSQEIALLGLVAVFGAAVFSMYPVIIAHASDHAAPGSFIQISGGILLMFGVGSIIGPTVAGFAMSAIGSSSLFLITGAAHLLMLLFTVLRIVTTPALPAEAKGAFQAGPLGRATTPETANLASNEVPEDRTP